MGHCWYFLTHRNNPQAHGITVVAFHPEVFRVSYFLKEWMHRSLLTSSPKITRRKIARVARFSRNRDPKLRQLCHYILTLGTDLYLVYQVPLASSSTPYLNVGDYKGQTGLSPPTAYPSTMEYEVNEGSLQPRHHVYAIDYYSSINQGYPSLSRPSTRVSTMGTDDELASK